MSKRGYPVTLKLNLVNFDLVSVNLDYSDSANIEIKQNTEIERKPELQKFDNLIVSNTHS